MIAWQEILPNCTNNNLNTVMKEITHCGNIDSTIILEHLNMQSEELSEESLLTNVVAWRKWCWHSLKEVMPAKNKTKQTKKKHKKTSQLKELLEIFHVFEHRKDITIKAYPNLERSVTISSV